MYRHTFKKETAIITTNNINNNRDVNRSKNTFINKILISFDLMFIAINMYISKITNTLKFYIQFLILIFTTI